MAKDELREIVWEALVAAKADKGKWTTIKQVDSVADYLRGKVVLKTASMVDVSPLKGFEHTGAFRCPKEGEWYHGINGEAQAASNCGTPYPILRRILPKLVQKARPEEPGEFLGWVCESSIGGNWRLVSWHFTASTQNYGVPARINAETGVVERVEGTP